MLRSFLFASALGAVVSLAASAAEPVVVQPAKAEQTVETRSLPLAGGSSFKVSNINGDLLVQGWDREELSFSGTFKPSSKGEQVKVLLIPGAKGLEIRCEYPKHTDRGRYRGPEVRLDLKVPRRILASLEAVNGDISLADVQGLAKLRTVNGSIQARNLPEGLEAESVNGNLSLEAIKARLEVQTVNGSIKAKGLEALSGGLQAKTVNGGVSLALTGVKGSLLASSLNGSISFKTQGATEVEIKRNSVKAKLGEGGPELRVKSLNGGITLE